MFGQKNNYYYGTIRKTARFHSPSRANENLLAYVLHVAYAKSVVSNGMLRKLGTRRRSYDTHVSFQTIFTVDERFRRVSIASVFDRSILYDTSVRSIQWISRSSSRVQSRSLIKAKVWNATDTNDKDRHTRVCEAIGNNGFHL